MKRAIPLIMLASFSVNADQWTHTEEFDEFNDVSIPIYKTPSTNKHAFLELTCSANVDEPGFVAFVETDEIIKDFEINFNTSWKVRFDKNKPTKIEAFKLGNKYVLNDIDFKDYNTVVFKFDYKNKSENFKFNIKNIESLKRNIDSYCKNNFK